jgi:hypothetical protein
MNALIAVIAVEIVPVIEGDDQYYKTIVFDLQTDPEGCQTRTVRDIFHSDSLRIAIGLLHQLSIDGTYDS